MRNGRNRPLAQISIIAMESMTRGRGPCPIHGKPGTVRIQPDSRLYIVAYVV